MTERRLAKVTALVRMITRTCACGADFAIASALPQRTCPACIDREFAQALDQFKAGECIALPTTLEEKLRAAGLRDVELSARLDRIPDGLKKKLPGKYVKPLVGGAHHSGVHGFGLSGGQGIGKTMAMAAMLRARTEALLTAALAAVLEAPAPGAMPWHAGAGFRWVNWPDQANLLKTLSMQRDGAAEVERFARGASTVGLLVVDDLGRERLGKSYDEDYAFGVLDRVIDARSRSALPLLWTSNLSRSGIATRYGAALTSRLLGLAPAVELPALADKRLS